MSQSHPLVSVIIPTKNSARTLDRCLKSIREQSYTNIELIVIDNASTDATKEIAQKYADHFYELGPERSTQRNFGVQKSHGRYVLIHDSDIYFDTESVAECVEFMKNTSFAAIIIPERSVGEGYWATVKSFERSFYLGNDYIEAPRFFDAQLFKKIGGYDEAMYAGEDWDLMIRIREQGGTIGRATRFVLHDEGRLDLVGSSKKKKYYASNLFSVYAKKHPEYFKKQMSFFTRFPLKKILTKGICHPILFASMIAMKSMELYSSTT
jgi:glycosyltransferase involved in cell wall biosynthesis